MPKVSSSEIMVKPGQAKVNLSLGWVNLRFG